MEETTLLSRAASGNCTHRDLENASYWVKQLSALVMGVAFGVQAMTGFTAVVTFVVSCGLLVWATFAIVLRADLRLLGLDGQRELLQEGGMSALAMFMLSWSVAFTLFSAPK